MAAAQAFFADIYAEAKRAKPSPGHKALAGIAAQGKLQRHYTLNIDGLAQAVGLSTWHSQKNPTGSHRALSALSSYHMEPNRDGFCFHKLWTESLRCQFERVIESAPPCSTDCAVSAPKSGLDAHAAGQTLEMHGSIREMVCPECGHVTDLTAPLLRAVRLKTALPCQKCHEADLRMRIMLYDDGEGVSSPPVLDRCSQWLSMPGPVTTELSREGFGLVLPVKQYIKQQMSIPCSLLLICTD